MKDYLVENQSLVGSPELWKISVQTSQNIRDISKIRSEMATKEDILQVQNGLDKVMRNFKRNFSRHHGSNDYAFN